jgi:hypothetical protein
MNGCRVLAGFASVRIGEIKLNRKTKLVRKEVATILLQKTVK